MRISKRARAFVISLATVMSITAVPAHANINLQGSGASFVGNVAVSYTHLTLPTNREV